MLKHYGRGWGWYDAEQTQPGWELVDKDEKRKHYFLFRHVSCGAVVSRQKSYKLHCPDCGFVELVMLSRYSHLWPRIQKAIAREIGEYDSSADQRSDGFPQSPRLA